MYATCIHCQQPLGANDTIEALPIGRRVAFDGDKGRLWVVCRSCDRWNLTPFDARWEALEQCERAYRDTQVRLSTDNIGLARLKDGTDLVRIGKPQLPEFAAWRYGDQFGRRRRKLIRNAAIGATVGVGGSLAWAGLLGSGIVAGTGSAVVTGLMYLNTLNSLAIVRRQRKMLANPMALSDGTEIIPAGGLRLIEMDVEERWGLEVAVLRETDFSSKRFESMKQYENAYLPVRGRDAAPVLRRYMPQINRMGASEAQVQESVALIETAGGPDRFGEWATSQRRAWAAKAQFGDTGDLRNGIPVPARLAFEMAVNEDTERRALQGELAQLETAWREAEELASIADGLTPMQKIEQQLASLRVRVRGR